MTKLFSIKYAVEGASAFPIDMLRYDASYPEQEIDSAHIAHHGLRGVNLVHLDEDSHWQPTSARWRSFGWQVISAKSPSRIRP